MSRSFMGSVFPKADVNNLYGDLPPEQHTHINTSSHSIFSSFLSSKLGLPLPNPAPDVSKLRDNFIFYLFIFFTAKVAVTDTPYQRECRNIKEYPLKPNVNLSVEC